MPHYCFKQPNKKYTVWSTIVDAPLLYNATKKEVWEHERVRDELEWKYWCKESLEDVLDEGRIECCLYNSMTKEELLDYFKEIKYLGKLYKYAKNWVRKEEEDEEFK